jgi:hypothetical protein
MAPAASAAAGQAEVAPSRDARPPAVQSRQPEQARRAATARDRAPSMAPAASAAAGQAEVAPSRDARPPAVQSRQPEQARRAATARDRAPSMAPAACRLRDHGSLRRRMPALQASRPLIRCRAVRDVPSRTSRSPSRQRGDDAIQHHARIWAQRRRWVSRRVTPQLPPGACGTSVRRKPAEHATGTAPRPHRTAIVASASSGAPSGVARRTATRT